MWFDFFPQEKHMNHRLRRHINEHHHLERFLQHDQEVLRFYAYWDDRARLFGDRHHLVIHHYLGDQTTEIVRKVSMSYGKEKLEAFVRRGRLPKVMSLINSPLRRKQKRICILGFLPCSMRKTTKKWTWDRRGPSSISSIPILNGRKLQDYFSTKPRQAISFLYLFLMSNCLPVKRSVRFLST